MGFVLPSPRRRRLRGRWNTNGVEGMWLWVCRALPWLWYSLRLFHLGEWEAPGLAGGGKEVWRDRDIFPYLWDWLGDLFPAIPVMGPRAPPHCYVGVAGFWGPTGDCGDGSWTPTSPSIALSSP